MSSRWQDDPNVTKGSAYDERFATLAARGENVHGEVDFLEALQPQRVLDAGCGTGRIAIELNRRGVPTVGVDLDPKMLSAAIDKAPELTWIEANLTTLDLDDTFDAIVMAGNIMLFVEPGTEAAVVDRLARHLTSGGNLVAGFSLGRGMDPATYDRLCAAAGLAAVARYATWDADPFTDDSSYLVAVHRRP